MLDILIVVLTAAIVAKTKRHNILDMGQEPARQEDIRTKGDCCFNHIVGLPTKDREAKPMFDYEKLLYNSLLSLKFIPTL
jgi:hypothetical protein